MDDKLSHVVCIRISDTLKSALTSVAKREKRKLRAMIRLILEDYCK